MVSNEQTAVNKPESAVLPAPRGSFAGGDRPKNLRRGGRRGSAAGSRPRSEFDQQILNIRRVARVTKGGKRFNFSVAIVIGNRKGSVGIGLGKGADTALAIDKATRHAKKHMIAVRTTKEMSIPHFVSAKYSSARVFIQPSPGRGIVAGSALKTVIDLAGLKDITAKVLSPSKNKLNMARAAIKALAILTNSQRPTTNNNKDQKISSVVGG
ncbi:MAG: 30S ribosomal protein S5 [Parcubacteria group bacterium GW2011_GWA2_47_21]|nr:MAG: 30S ribosomal protein S5 [Parcubacteria group bacterium GW2011_GWA2_47_21]